MRLISKYFLYSAVVFSCVLGFCITSCNDDIPAGSYYTFTGEMLSDYLKERSQFSEFVKIIERSKDSERGVNLMDLISTYGQFTCFAPDNDAVATYLKENGYSSVSDIPADLCDTIARTHLVAGRAFGTEDMLGATSLSSVNMNDRYLQVQEAFAYEENGDTIYTADTLEIEGKEDIHNTYRINRSGYIYYNLCNDSVENGMVHIVNAVLASSNQSVASLAEENEHLSLFTQAMNLVGLTEILQTRVKDESWDPDLYEDRHVYSGAQTDYCHIPETKNYGFTVFACPDDVLAEKYGITDMQTFYDYARGIYGGDDLDVSDPANAEALTDWRSPLRRLIGYNILKQKGQYSDLTSITTIETTQVNPTEWYATMDSLTTIKVERLTVTRYIGYGENDIRNDLYLNRGDMSRGCYTPGIHVSEIDGEYVNDGLNGIYFITDGLADYGEETKQDIFNTRMRMDFYYMFPELMTNNVRDGRTNNSQSTSNEPDKNIASPNYWFPNGYLDNVKVNDDGIFLFQSQHNTYWSYEGDEFNLASDVNSYDITFNLPSVPSGTYQIRLGFAPMPTRGICQFYLDGEPQGIPFDMRDTNLEDRIGFFNLTDGSSYTLNSEEWEAAKKNMHNMGWYHGPRSVFSFGTEGTLDGSNSTKNLFCNNVHTMRYVLCTTNLDENTQHTVRIKSIWAVGTALVMIDYLELVPKSVYGVEGEGKAEDDY